MTEKDKLTLRKPLAPNGENAECKAAYEELLKEFNELREWKVDGIDYISSFDKPHVVSLEQYNARIGEYAARRDLYNKKFAGSIETIEDVRANIKKLREQKDAADKVDDRSALVTLLVDEYEEECKFEEIQKEVDAAFEYTAKHMLADGSGRMLTDEELAEREAAKR